MHAHDEEEACKDALWDEMENYKEGASHCSLRKESLDEIRNALFDNMRCFSDDVTFGGFIFICIGDDFCHAERGGVKRCLRDETVGEGDSKDAGYTCGDAEEEDIPVKAGWFAEGKFGTLSDQGRYCK